MDNFSGINSIYQSEDQSHLGLRILIVHGIGTDCPSLAEPLIVGLANSFGLKQIQQGLLFEDPKYLSKEWPSDCKEPAVKLQDGDSLRRPLGTPLLVNPNVPLQDWVPTDNEALLYTYHFSKDGNWPSSLSISFLLWSPLTYQIKTKISDLPQEGAPSTQIVSHYAKYLLQMNFSDAVLYAGQYRINVMRPAVEAAICRLNGGEATVGDTCKTPDPGMGSEAQRLAQESDQPVVVITHSLGSYMLTDALNDIATQKNATGHYYNFASHVTKIFMLANQLPLLDLSDLTHYPVPLGQRTPDISPANPYPNVHQLVAFSDPNDILSYEVTSNDFADQNIIPINVYLGNGEWEIPGVYSDEIGAHDNSFTNKVILRLIVCGMANGTINKNECPNTR